LFCIYSSLEAQLFPALRGFDGDVVLARPVDFQTGLTQRGKNILALPDKSLSHFGGDIVVNGVLGLGPFILARSFAPAEQSGPVQIGMVRRPGPCPGGIIWPCPAFPVVVKVAEHIKVFLPAGRTGVKFLAARQIQTGNDKMEFMVSGMTVAHPEDIALIRLQPGKGHCLKVIHDTIFLLRRHLVVRMPG
jgi:hypothetical protein